MIGIGLLFLSHYLAFRKRKVEGEGRLNEFFVHWGMGGSYGASLKSGCLVLVFRCLAGAAAVAGIFCILRGFQAFEGWA